MPTPAAELLKRPALARGELNLLVPPLTRTLAGGQAAGGQAGAGRHDRGGRSSPTQPGQPVANAELAVAVVDESILALDGYDARSYHDFYSERWTEVNDYNRPNIVLASPDQLDLDAANQRRATWQRRRSYRSASRGLMPAAVEVEKSVEMVVEELAAEPGASIAVRQDSPAGTGRPRSPPTRGPRATVKLPDNPTRHRVIVVAVAGGKQFGIAAAHHQWLPLMVRPSPASTSATSSSCRSSCRTRRTS